VQLAQEGMVGAGIEEEHPIARLEAQIVIAFEIVVEPRIPEEPRQPGLALMTDLACA
jgi:threonine synthase